MEENMRFITGYYVDNEGFIIETIPIDLENYVAEDNLIVTQPKQSFCTFKWNGTEWIEGVTQEEIEEREAQQLLESMKPSQNELSDAELEIKIITLLTDLEVV